MPRIHRLQSRYDSAIVCDGGQGWRLYINLGIWAPLTSVENHADKDGAEEKVELNVPLVLLPREAVPRVGAGGVANKMFKWQIERESSPNDCTPSTYIRCQSLNLSDIVAGK